MSAYFDTSTGREQMFEEASQTSGTAPTSGSCFHSTPSMVSFEVKWT